MTLTEALAALKAAGKIRSARLPGMLFKDSLGRTARKTGFQPPEATLLVGHRTMEASQAQPDLTDAATVGCLLALLREAWGRPEVSVAYDAEDQRWTLVAWDSEMGWRDAKPGWPLVGPTEGEAIAAALIALAGGAALGIEEVPRG